MVERKPRPPADKTTPQPGAYREIEADRDAPEDPEDDVTRLGTTAEEADRTLKERAHSRWEQRTAPREKGSRWIAAVAIVIGIAVVVWLIVTTLS